MGNSYAKIGQIIDGRYVLTVRAIRDFSPAGTSVWLATDTFLSLQVRVIVLDPALTQKKAVLDAARKSALVKDPRTVAIIRVIDSEEISAVVTELPLGTPLSVFLDSAPLTVPVAHAIVGQVAKTISDFRHYGIPCLLLDPGNIYITDSYRVILDGIGISAALCETASPCEPGGGETGVETGQETGDDLDLREARVLTDFLRSLLPPGAKNLPQQILDVIDAEDSLIKISSAGDVTRTLVPWDNSALSSLPQNLLTLGNGYGFPVVHQEALAENNFEATGASNGAEAERHPFSSFFGTEDETFPDTFPSSDADKNSVPPETDAASGFGPGIREKHLWDSVSLDKNVPGPGIYAAEDGPTGAENAPAGEEIAQNTARNREFADRSVNTSKFVLAGFGVLLCIAFLGGVLSLLKPLDPVSTVTPARHTAVKTGHPKAARHTAEQPKAPTVSVPPVIAKAETVAQDGSIFTFRGNSSKRLREDAAKAIDSNPNTAWKSWYYKRKTVYARNKIGLRIDLKEEADVSEINIATQAAGGRVQIKETVPSGDPGSGKTLGEAPFAENVHFTLPKGTKLTSFTVWIDDLPVNARRENCAVISEITVK